MFDIVAYYCPGEDLTFINSGYAKVSHDGIVLQEIAENPELFRIQLYNHCVVNAGGFKSMKGKSLLETGCGKGGGLHYLVNLLKPAEAMGVDISPLSVSNILQQSE